MSIDLSGAKIALLDKDYPQKHNDAMDLIEAELNGFEADVNAELDSHTAIVEQRLNDQDAILDGLAGAMSAGVTFKGTHSAAGGAYPVGPTSGDYWIISAAGTISGVYFNIGDSIVYYGSSWIRIPATPDMSAINPLAKAIRVAITAATSGSNGIQALDNANLDMATNNFTPFVRKRISTTRPASNEILYQKHDGTTGVIITLLTTGIIQLTLNGFVYASTAALPVATNVAPLIMTPVNRETATVAGSVTFVVDGVQLGNALAIAIPAEKVTNGTFGSDITGWTLSGGGTITWNSGKLRVERVSDVTSAYQAISFAAGETRFFKATLTEISGGASGRIILRDGTNIVTSTALGVGNTLTGSGTSSFSYTSATAQTLYLHAMLSGGAAIKDFDDITSIPTTYSVDNAVSLYCMGTSATRTEGDYFEHGVYNRALTVAECLRHALMGPNPLDIGGGWTPVHSSNFSAGVDSWGVATMTMTGNNDGIGGENDCAFAACTTTGTATNVRIARGLIIPAVGKYATITLRLYRPASNGTVVGFELANNDGVNVIFSSVARAITTAADTWQTFTFSGLVVQTTGSMSLRLYPINASGTRAQAVGEGLYFKSVISYHNGLAGWWNADDAQSNTGQIFDRSGNKGHAILPAAGATILPRAPRTFQIRSTHSWAETHEMQYLTLVNQPVVPATAKLVRIFGEISSTGGSGPQDFTIGDSSDSDRYVVLTSGLTTGKKEFTIDTTYSGFNDGTNLKVTIDPDANCTMTVALVLVFETLE